MTQATVNVDEDIVNQFENQLRQQLREAGFKNNKDLTLNYRFIQVNEGSRFGRWFLGGIGNVGEGTLTTEIKFLDVNRKEIGKVHAEGKISSGMFGGGFSNAIDSAIEEIMNCTKQINRK